MLYKKDQIPLFMTVPELAKVMRINVTKAYQLVKVEGFPSIKMGRKILVPRDSFFKWYDRANGIIM